MRGLYRWYGLGIVAFMAWAVFTGWGWADVDEVKQVPKSVRDNPGAYRAHYRTYHRYYGGK